jgi:hypothetical protein
MSPARRRHFNPAGVAVIPAPLPEALAASLDSPYPSVRIGAVNALGHCSSGHKCGRLPCSGRAGEAPCYKRPGDKAARVPPKTGYVW